MLAIPFKRTANIDVVSPIMKYLNSKYGREEAAKHRDTINQFQNLRSNVSVIEQANDASRDLLLTYLAQLEYAQEKFASGEHLNQLMFRWNDIFTGKIYDQFSWAYEKASVIFQLAAHESFLGTSISRDTPANIEAASKRFCAAAGYIRHIRETLSGQLIGALPLDLSPEGLLFLENIMLAQGQMCVFEMARLRESKPELCARLAGAAADLYRQALRALSDTRAAAADTDFCWTLFVKYYSCVLDAASFYQFSKKVLAEARAAASGYGNEIAWLTAANSACDAALTAVRTSRHKQANRIPTSTLEQLKSEVSTRLQAATYDNNHIYLNAVPALPSLPIIPRAELAKAGPGPDYTAQKAAGNPFASIVPAQVVAALNQIDDRLNGLVNAAKDRCKDASERARTFLSSKGLPGSLEPSTGAGGVPTSVWDKVQKTQIEGGMSELDRIYAANMNANAECKATLTRAIGILNEEAGNDAGCRARFGARWTATPSDALTGEMRLDIARKMDAAEQASHSDEVVRQRLIEAKPKLELIAKTQAELNSTVPAAAASTPAGASTSESATIREELRPLVRSLQELIDSRVKLCQDIKDTFDRNGAINALCAAPTHDHTTVIERLINGPSPAKAAIEANLAEQARLLDLIETTHTRYVEVKASDPATRAREAAIQKILDAVDIYESLRSDLRQGTDFYGQLRGHADRLLREAMGLCEARTVQQRELMLFVSQEVTRAEASGAAAAAGAASAYPTLPSVPAPASFTAGAGGGGGVAPGVPAGAVGGTTAPAGQQSMVSGTIQPSTLVNPFDLFTDGASHSAGGAAGGAAPAFVPTASAAQPAALMLGRPRPVAPAPAAPAPQYFPAPTAASAAAAFSPSAGGSGYPGGAPATSLPYAPPGVPPPSGGMLGGPAPAAGVPDGVDPRQVSQLVNMGFEREAVVRVLRDARGNVDQAIAMLLSAGAS